jgi:hypothetical protein
MPKTISNFLTQSERVDCLAESLEISEYIILNSTIDMAMCIKYRHHVTEYFNNENLQTAGTIKISHQSTKINLNDIIHNNVFPITPTHMAVVSLAALSPQDRVMHIRQGDEFIMEPFPLELDQGCVHALQNHTHLVIPTKYWIDNSDVTLSADSCVRLYLLYGNINTQ